MITAITGHRPVSLRVPNPYSTGVFQALVDTLTAAFEQYNVTYVISGMALGVDQAAARAAINTGIPWRAAVPFEGQELRWPKASQNIYRGLLAQADRVTVVGLKDFHSIGALMQRRNRYMVDHAEQVLALWNGKPGGTGNCVTYAQTKGILIHNCWDAFHETLSASTASS